MTDQVSTTAADIVANLVRRKHSLCAATTSSYRETVEGAYNEHSEIAADYREESHYDAYAETHTGEDGDAP